MNKPEKWEKKDENETKEIWKEKIANEKIRKGGEKYKWMKRNKRRMNKTHKQKKDKKGKKKWRKENIKWK